MHLANRGNYKKKAFLLYKHASNKGLAPSAVDVNEGPGQFLRKYSNSWVLDLNKT